MNILTVNLKGIYFHQIKSGTKVFEFRLRTPYWRKRLEHRSYDAVRICWGYPKKGDSQRELIRRWRGYEEQTIQHEHFGSQQVEVFAIHVGEPIPGLGSPPSSSAPIPHHEVRTGTRSPSGAL